MKQTGIKKGGLLICVVIFFSFICMPRISAREKVGLVLSGGGAKGIAHVGVIKALEDADIPFDYVAGTSMGAIVGSLYSCGWTPEQMMNLFLSESFKYWSSGTINRNLEYYFSLPEPSSKWLTLNFTPNDSTNIFSHILPSSLINPIPMNLEFLELYSPYTDQCEGNFNDLFVPFRCVTSDVYHKHKIVLKSGSLGDAVRASMSFPMVFKPIEMDGVLVYDGGIYDNFPVDVMIDDFHPDFIIGVSVSGPDGKPIKGDLYSQLEDMIIQNNDYNLPPEEGVKIQVPVLNYGVLDWSSAEEIYSIGYRTGLSMVDSIKKRLPARESLADVNARRKVFAQKTPDVKFDEIVVTGANPSQSRYIKYLFQGKKPEEAINLEQVRNGYYRAVGGNKFYDLLPQAKFGKDGKDTLLLEANIRKPWSIGAGGWVSTSTNSMLYLTAGYHTLNFNSLDIDLGGWFGQSYYAAQLSAKFGLTSSIPSYIEIEGVFSRQKYYDSEILFYESNTPAYITDSQFYARLGYCWAIGRPAKGYVNIAYGKEENKFYPESDPSFTVKNRDRSLYHIAALKAGIELNTLNNPLYPSSGKQWLFNLLLTHEDNKFIPGDENSVKGEKWRTHYNGSIELLWQHYFNIHNNFKVAGFGNILGSIEKLYQDYTSTLIHMPAFAPTPSTKNYFNPGFRSNNYVAVGLIPVWSPINRAQLRGDFYFYCPIRNIGENKEGIARYDGWFHKPQFIGELAAVYNFPFASLSLYANYLTSPSHNWNFGINFGLFFQAPKLLR